MKSTNDTADLARRVRQALAEARLTSAEVAVACGVTPQAVNGWKKTGRIGKEQLPKLVELTGRPLSWWLGSDEQDQQSATNSVVERLTRIVGGRSPADVERIVDAIEILLDAPRAFEVKAGGSVADETEPEVVIQPPPRRRRKQAANE
ncbi:helix-turn-helix domain-containing protein [Paraburkholderia sp. 32]|uniref:helix-turn-helix domain-containing protein n=1 Tax=Paraburkholderia sp. 32 TaxID=2991057 RepID=UPI003D20E024